MMPLWPAVVRSFSEFFDLSSPIQLSTSQFYVVVALGMSLMGYGSVLQLQTDDNPGWTALAVGLGAAFAIGLAIKLSKDPAAAAWIEGMALLTGRTAAGVSLALGLRLVAPFAGSLAMSVCIPFSFAVLWWRGIAVEEQLVILTVISFVASLAGVYHMLFRDVLVHADGDSRRIKARSCVASGYVMMIGAAAAHSPELLSESARTGLLWVAPAVAAIGLLTASRQKP